jgi:arylsulfatase A
MKNILIPTMCLATISACTSKPTQEKITKPNILLIYVDDMGYGDIGLNGAIGVTTPNIDRLAMNGLNLTNAHCSAATSTPSRYSLITGRYAFRNNAQILPGDAPLIINPDMGTLPKMLQKAGYTTGVIGKWHLGLGRGTVNWNEEIVPGPREVGFDYSFIIPATGDRVPCVYVENQKVVGLDPSDPIMVSFSHELEGYPTGTKNPELLRMNADIQHSNTIVNGISRIGFMSGGENALWKDEDFPILFNEKARQFIMANKEKPFFLYYASHDIHVPRLPNPMFVGKSSMGPRGDAIAQIDWCTGELVKILEEAGVANNTLIIFTSDNGPILDDGYEDHAVELVGNHKPNGIFRGSKYSAFEAGTRVPTIVYWPGAVKPGTVSDALLTQVDLYASLAKLVGQNLNPGDAPDSFNFLDAWLGKTKIGRQIEIQESFTLAIRDKKWKYIHPQEAETPEWLENKNVETGLYNETQLYDLSSDLAEQRNIASKYPKKVKEMQKKLHEIREK